MFYHRGFKIVRRAGEFMVYDAAGERFGAFDLMEKAVFAIDLYWE